MESFPTSPARALPPVHVARPRLVAALADVALGMVEAPGGYGKSTLAAELRAFLGVAAAEAVVEDGSSQAGAVLGALRRGLRQAGLSDLAAAAGAGGVDGLLDALSRAPDSVLLVVDEVQRASGEALDALIALARGLPRTHRLLFVGRRIDARLARLRLDAGTVFLAAPDLEFDDDELAALLTAVSGEAPSPSLVGRLRRQALGWPAASVLAATRLSRGQEAGAPASDGRSTLASLLTELLAGVRPAQLERIAWLAHLPLLSERVAEACAGPGALDVLLDAGLPLRAGRVGWIELPDPVRDELAARAPLAPAAARAAAAAYADSGELRAGLTLLARGGDFEGIAELLAGRRWQELGALEPAELRAAIGTIPEAALRRFPMALVQTARVFEQRAEVESRRDLLARAVDLADADGDALGRELRAELADAAAVVDPSEQVAADAAAVLAAAGPEEVATRFRALSAMARVEAWIGDPASMVHAGSRLAEAAALCALAGEREWQASTLMKLGYRVSFARGDFARAIEHMQAALALLPEPTTERGTSAVFLADSLQYLGRIEEAEGALREAGEIARALGDHALEGYVNWSWMDLASVRLDRAETIQRIRAAERHPGEWFEHPTGIEFLAHAALALARVDEGELAASYARRAATRADAAGYPEIAWIASGAVEARFGDPVRGDELLRAYAASPQQPPRDEWHTLLLRAVAAQRAGDPAAGALAAEAYEAVAALGRPDLPQLREPALAALLAPLAAAAGSRTAASIAQREQAFRVTLLGGFGVSADGRPLEPPPGRPSTLVKLLALAGRPVPADEAVDVLWPDVDQATGRSRMRNLLNRLRSSCGDLVIRSEGALELAASAAVDAAQFEASAVAATSAGPDQRAGLARAAIALYAGELLPADVYATWATAPRERLKRRHLELLDLLADDAAERGDLDEAIRRLDQAAAEEPLDEDRYVRAAELLLFQGRRGSARTLVDRAVATRVALGLPESPRLVRLRGATG